MGCSFPTTFPLKHGSTFLISLVCVGGCICVHVCTLRILSRYRKLFLVLWIWCVLFAFRHVTLYAELFQAAWLLGVGGRVGGCLRTVLQPQRREGGNGSFTREEEGEGGREILRRQREGEKDGYGREGVGVRGQGERDATDCITLHSGGAHKDCSLCFSPLLSPHPSPICRKGCSGHCSSPH